jgi:hypothetical protein
MKCIHCESENIQKLSVIYANGTSKTTGQIRSIHTGGGLGFGSGGIGAFAGGGNSNSTVDTTSTTDLARKCAPPAKFEYKSSVIMIIVSAILFYGLETFNEFGIGGIVLLSALGLLGFAVFKIIKGKKYNDGEYLVLREAWSKKWHCNKCGEIF